RATQAERVPAQRVTALAIATCLAAAATTVKLSAFGLLSGMCGVALAWVVATRWRRPMSRQNERPAAVLGALAIVNIAAWIGGNVVLSGYPLYPSVVGGLP